MMNAPKKVCLQMFSGAHSCDPAGTPAITRSHTQCAPALPASGPAQNMAQPDRVALHLPPFPWHNMWANQACMRTVPAAEGFPDGQGNSVPHGVQLELTAPNASQE